MKRPARHKLTTFSAIAGALIILLWAASYRWEFQLSHYRLDEHSELVGTRDDRAGTTTISAARWSYLSVGHGGVSVYQVHLGLVEPPTAETRKFEGYHFRVNPSERYPYWNSVSWATIYFQSAGFELATAVSGASDGGAILNRNIVFPLALPLFLAAILPARWLIRQRRRRLLLTVSGPRCTACGYDLRTTPDPSAPPTPRCPECGMVTTPT